MAKLWNSMDIMVREIFKYGFKSRKNIVSDLNVWLARTTMSVGNCKQYAGIKLRVRNTWVKVFRNIPEFRMLRLTFNRKSASKY